MARCGATGHRRKRAHKTAGAHKTAVISAWGPFLAAPPSMGSATVQSLSAPVGAVLPLQPASVAEQLISDVSQATSTSTSTTSGTSASNGATATTTTTTTTAPVATSTTTATATIATTATTATTSTTAAAATITSAATTTTTTSSSTTTAPTPFRFFSPTSFWNQAVPADAAVESSSAAVISAFLGEIEAEQEEKKGPTVNTTSWSVPIYKVGASAPTLNVTLEKESSSPALQAAWQAVPLPEDADPAQGSDKHLVVWQPASDKLWEFWGLEKVAAGWQAAWGGAMEKVSSEAGVYGPQAWPGAKTNWGASSTSLSIAGGLITLEDLQDGRINHALAIAIPRPRAQLYAAPAQRDDGFSTSPVSIPEGAHLRLDPSLNLAALKLPRFTLMLAQAAQRYGIFVRDRAANVAFYAQDPTPTGSNPYSGAHGYFEGEGALKLLEAFPWNYLELLKLELHG